MIDPTNTEILAMQSTLKPLGEYVASIDGNKPLSQYSRQDVLTLVEVVITAYQDFMQDAANHTQGVST